MARPRKQNLDDLTPAEKRIFKFLNKKLLPTNEEIAEKMQVKKGTVKNHLNNIYDKLGIEGTFWQKRRELHRRARRYEEAI